MGPQGCHLGLDVGDHAPDELHAAGGWRHRDVMVVEAGRAGERLFERERLLMNIAE